MVAADGPGNVPSEAPADTSAGLRWTLHDLPDMGIATLTAFAERDSPEDVLEADVESFAQYFEQKLSTPSLRSHASVLFTINTPYLQPSFSPEKRADKAHALLRANTAAQIPDDADPCVFCGRPAIKLETATGRAYRELVPLLTGQGTVNFAPYGDHGLPLCGLCVVSLQALALGAPSCEGRALIIGADDPQQLVQLIGLWLPQVQRRLQLSESTSKKVDPWKAPRTRLVDYLSQLADRSAEARQPTSFRLYHASNSGQGPALDLYVLDAGVVAFVQRARTDRFRRAWSRAVRRAWRNPSAKLQDAEPDDETRTQWRNTLYEELFRLPMEAGRFARRWFVQPQIESARDPNDGEHTPMWPIAELFLEEVLAVDSERIKAIRDLGDGLADEIAGQNDRRLFRQSIYQGGGPGYRNIRSILIRVSRRRVERDEPPLVDLDTFLTIFEESEELPRRDWQLAWDMVVIRLIDKLYERHWFSQNKEVVREENQAADARDAGRGEDDEGEDLPSAK